MTAGQGVILGIDTSLYRTSVCLVDAATGRIIAERNPLLHVPEGKRGLQQSAAFFQHVKELPALVEAIAPREAGIAAIGASIKPRPQPDSYMPVFLAGESFARSWAALFGVPLYRTSHQEGHIAAGEGTSEARPQGQAFLAIHLSGGTSEILRVVRGEGGYAIDCLGGTRDLHAGQFVDRVGVALGLSFPAGPSLEKLASAGADANPADLDASGTSAEPSAAFRLPSAVDGLSFSFSGPTTAALRAIAQGTPPAAVARAVEQCIANTLAKVVQHAIVREGLRDVLVVGGVAANRYIRERLRRRLEHRAIGARLYFADPAYSTDNAYGVALIAREQWLANRDADEISNLRTFFGGYK